MKHDGKPDKSSMSADELKVLMEIERRDILIDIEKIKGRFNYVNLLSDLVKNSGLKEIILAYLKEKTAEKK